MRIRPSSTGRIVVNSSLFLAMALVGWTLTDPSKEGEEEREISIARPTKSERGKARRDRQFGAPEMARQKLRAIEQATTSEEKMRLVIALVNEMPIDELEKWLDLRWFDSRAGFELTLFNKLANKRWAEEDPEGYLAWTSRESNGNFDGKIASWAEENPQRVLNFFKNNPDPQREVRALQEIAKTNPSLALQRFQEILKSGGLGSTIQYIGVQLIHELAAGSPEILEAALDSLPDGVRFQAEASLIGQRLKASGDISTEISRLTGRPDGWKVFAQAMSAAGKRDQMIDQFEGFPRSWKINLSQGYHGLIRSSNASKWLELDFEGSGIREQQIEQIRYYALSEMSSDQPAQALRSLDDAGIEGDRRKGLIRDIFSRTENQMNASELLAELSSEEDRTIAQGFLDERTKSPEVAVASSYEDPGGWIEMATSPDMARFSHYEMLNRISHWDEGQLAEFSKKFESLPSEEKDAVAQILTQNSPYRMETVPQRSALEYLISSHEPQADDDRAAQRTWETIQSTTVRYAVQWSMNDPIAASEWTNSLPDGSAKLVTQKNLAATWIKYDDAAARQWINSLPADVRVEVNEFVAEH